MTNAFEVSREGPRPNTSLQPDERRCGIELFGSSEPGPDRVRNSAARGRAAARPDGLSSEGHVEELPTARRDQSGSWHGWNLSGVQAAI
jgi:hypothetical protein